MTRSDRCFRKIGTNKRISRHQERYAQGMNVILTETEIAEIQKMVAAIQRKLASRVESDKRGGENAS
jgi:hypothetical protein